MAKLQRTYIELVKNPEEAEKGGEVEVEKVWTPAFIPWRIVRQALQTLSDNEGGKVSDFDMLDRMENFVANDVFKGQITVDDLRDRLHAPNGIEALQGVIEFVSSGNQKDETRDFLEKKN